MGGFTRSTVDLERVAGGDVLLEFLLTKKKAGTYSIEPDVRPEILGPSSNSAPVVFTTGCTGSSLEGPS